MGDALNYLRRRGLMVTNDQAITGREVPYTPGALPIGGNLPPTGRFQATAKKADVFDEHHYAKLNGSQAWPLVAATSTLVLPGPNTLRNYLMFRNAEASGGANITIEFGNAAGPFAALLLTPGDQILFDTVVPQDDVFAYAVGATATLVVAYSNTPGSQA